MSTTSIDSPKPRSAVASPPRQSGFASQAHPVDVVLVDDDRAASYALWALLAWHPRERHREDNH